MTKTMRYGIDSSGRPILATQHAEDWLNAFATACKNGPHHFTPVIVQGAFMASLGGGAAASAGVHDLAGTYDFRVRDLTPEQLQFLVREARRRGAAAWHRDAEHGGMDPHCHLVICDDALLSSGAAQQVRDYRAGLDGLASRGRDYHWRPDPLVTHWTKPKKEKPVIVTPPPKPRNHVQKGRDALTDTVLPGLREAITEWKAAKGRDVVNQNAISLVNVEKALRNLLKNTPES